MFQLAETLDGAVLWTNLHLLFWLSLLPFTTGWMGENHFERWPTVLYGANLLACAIAFTILQTSIIRHDGKQAAARQGRGERLQGKDLAGDLHRRIACAWFLPAWTGMAFFVLAALMWFVPDRRMERAIRARGGGQG
jgi:uncharacterized membrane protein